MRHGDGRAVRAARDSATGPQAADATTMAEQGWLALALPEEAGGMGLGLAIAEEIVKLHGGSLNVESMIGSGATFVVGLPKNKLS